MFLLVEVLLACRAVPARILESTRSVSIEFPESILKCVSYHISRTGPREDPPRGILTLSSEVASGNNRIVPVRLTAALSSS